MPRHRPKSAFTLLEMLAVITIIGIISAIAVSRVSQHALDAKRKCCLQYKADINAAVEKYLFDHNSLPSKLSDLEGEYYGSELPKCPVAGTAYQLDPLVGRVVGHDH